MQAQLIGDIFATKDVEYLLVIGFLGALVLFWRLLRPVSGTQSDSPSESAPSTSGEGWFRCPAELHYHHGHSWIRPDPDGLVTVGIDDFALKLVGHPTGVGLPAVGARVEQGAHGSRLQFGERSIDVLAPVDGEVVDRNEIVMEEPDLLNHDPYGAGWLLRIRPARLGANLGNLLHGRAVLDWMGATVLQDGGVPVTGIAPELFGDDWVDVAKTLLLPSGAEDAGEVTDDEAEG
jgi:glycine cleavage system H lipoate-binding protein